MLFYGSYGSNPSHFLIFHLHRVSIVSPRPRPAGSGHVSKKWRHAMQMDEFVFFIP